MLFDILGAITYLFIWEVLINNIIIRKQLRLVSTHASNIVQIHIHRQFQG